MVLHTNNRRRQIAAHVVGRCEFRGDCCHRWVCRLSCFISMFLRHDCKWDDVDGAVFIIDIDADPYIPNGWGAQWYTNQNNLWVSFPFLPSCLQIISIHFSQIHHNIVILSSTLHVPSFRSVRNLIIDVRRMPPSAKATGLHWQVSQATSLMNVTVLMSTVPGNNHQGELQVETIRNTVTIMGE